MGSKFLPYEKSFVFGSMIAGAGLVMAGAVSKLQILVVLGCGLLLIMAVHAMWVISQEEKP